MHQFKELKVWQKGRMLVKEIYNVTNDFPKDEIFGLTSQIRRCTTSIPANIAEGCGRGTNNELNRFLDIANGSAFELETFLILSLDLKYIIQEQFNLLDEKVQEVQKMIYSLKKTLK